MISGHCQWRDCEEWRHLGIPLSTTSNEAAKLFDMNVTQLTSMYDDESLGGVSTTLKNLLCADPSWVIGHAMKVGAKFLAQTQTLTKHAEFRDDVEIMLSVANKQELPPWEDMHVKAAHLCALGHMDKAVYMWEDILALYPTDPWALKLAYVTSLYLGWNDRLQNIVPGILPSWRKSMPLYGYLYGMYAFGLCENNQFEQAECWSKKGLDLNRHDVFSTHALVHVYEMQSKFDEGIRFLDATECDWSVCNMFSGHNYWHWANYLAEKGQFGAAIDVFDKHLSPRCYSSKGSVVDLSDGSSLLLRLQMEDVKLDNRWHGICNAFKEHADKMQLLFYDVHLLMASLGAQDVKTTESFMSHMKEYSQGSTVNQILCHKFGLPLCNALKAFSDGDYSDAVDFLWPVRHEIPLIGGSKAQQDVFHLLLINASIRSNQKKHWEFARVLLNERKFWRPNTPRTARLSVQLQKNVEV